MAIPPGAVVVGFDGSTRSRLALDWAAAEAPRLARPLAVLVVQDDLSQVVARDNGDRARLELLVAEVYEDLYRRGVDDIAVDLVGGPPSRALVEAAAQASMLVLGEHRPRLLTGMAIRSVSRRAIARAPCPVVVVHPPRDPVSRLVLVGMGANGASLHALTFGLDLARRHELAVLALLAGRPAAVGDRVLAAQLEGWAERYPEVILTRKAVPEDALRALTLASRHAALAVVGSREGGPGVSRGLMHRAACPVAVVP